MKLLENVNLDEINSLLRQGSWSFAIAPIIENYSCKMVADDKRMFKEMCSKAGTGPRILSPAQTPMVMGDESPLSGFSSAPQAYLSTPPQLLHLSSHSTSEGEEVTIGEGSGLASTTTTKTLFYLISTLNSCFSPDYDFTDAKSEEFCKEPSAVVVCQAINEILSTFLENYPSIRDRVWQVVNEEIVINECEVYSYRPDGMSDPYSEGCISSFNYFFYNKNLKRILFFSVRISSPSLNIDNDEDDTSDFDFD